MASIDIKSFYKQKKKSGGGGGISKPSSSSSSTSKQKKSGKKQGGGATLGSGDPAQDPALIAHRSYDLQNEYGEEEERLRGFDMDMRYGPCIGISRLERWQRAHSMGLNPPSDVHQLLLCRASSSATATTASGLECLWEGRV